MLRGLFARRQDGPDETCPDRAGGARAESARVKDLVRRVFGLPEGTGLTASEIECLDPSCPGIETVILIMAEGEKVRAVKIGKPMPDILEADVAEVFAEVSAMSAAPTGASSGASR